MTAAPFVATLAAGVFFGAALYISLVQHPAAMVAGIDVAARLFAPMVRRAAVMQASAALLGTVAGLLAWWSGGGRGWLAGALLLFAVIPVTLLWIEPVNAGLRAPDPAADAAALLDRWARLHAVRTALGGAAFVLFALACARP